MPCFPTCMLALALLIAMIYFQNATLKSKIVQEYKKQLLDKVRNFIN